MRITLPQPKPCPDCGSDPVFHIPDYFGMVITNVFMPSLAATDHFFATPFRSLLKHKTISFGVHFCRLLARLHLGEFLDAYDDKTLLLDQVLWDEARTRGIVMREFRPLGLPTASFIAQYPNSKEIYFNSFPLPPGTRHSPWWLDTKTMLKKKLAKAGFPVAQGGGAITRHRAHAIFKSLTPPVIVKPYSGSGSRHTTTHITTLAELDRAFAVGRQIAPMCIIEEELVGSVYRPTVVGGTLIATIRRDVPQVIGDGTHTVRELVEAENTNPKRRGPYYQPIALNKDTGAELARQGFSLESIPPKGRVVLLHQKINWSVGGTTTDVTDEVHPENKKLFEDIAQFLKTPMVGIDFIIGDISRPWHEQNRCGVIECNSRPFFDNHHLPFNGKPRNVAGAIWDYAEKGRV